MMQGRRRTKSLCGEPARPADWVVHGFLRRRSERFPVATYRASRRSRRALAMTDTELKVIAALAMIGLKSSPNTG